MNRQPSTSISGKHRSENFGEALGITCQELRDRISALELKQAELTGAIDILRGTPPPPERDTRALGELLSTERREFGDLLERRTRGFELKLAELTGAIDILRGTQPPPPAQFPSVKAFSADTIYHEGDIVAFAGGAYQAAKDTARAPGAQDWVCLAPRRPSRAPPGSACRTPHRRCPPAPLPSRSGAAACCPA